MLQNIFETFISSSPLLYLTQSLWRDEAFSFFIAQKPFLEVIKSTANDFNPPLYYLLLHFWILIVGRNDELIRLLSLLPHILGGYFTYRLAKKISTKNWAIFTTLIYLFNPMLLYYAFEIRMYSWYALFTVGSIYFYYLSKWKSFLFFQILGLYTHSFFPIVSACFIFMSLFSKKNKVKKALLSILPLIFFVPWIPILIRQFMASGNSWIYPVDIQLIQASLGNLLINYEGTPGGLWKYSSIASLGIIILSLIAVIKKRKNLLFVIPIFLPLFLILAFSFFKRPVYVNRYLIFVTVFEVLIISQGIFVINNKYLKSAIASAFFSFLLIYNMLIPSYIKKTDFKKLFREIKSIAHQEDFIYCQTPISFLESAYYYNKPEKVFIYNPKGIKIPSYIGIDAAFLSEVSRKSFPEQASRIFLIKDNANYEIIYNAR